MALTKVSRGLLSTGIVDNSNATAITLNADESATFSGAISVTGTATMDGLTVNSGTTNTVATFESTDSTVVIPLIDSVGSTQIRSIDGAFAIRTGGDGGSNANTLERTRIDSSGRQLIGYTSSVGTAYQTNLQVKGSTASNYGGLGIISSNNEMLGVVGTWSNGENSLMIAADPDNLRSNSSIVFTTDATERMRLSGGILMVGTTDTAPGAGNTNAGVSIRGASDNRSFFSVNGDYVMHLNRNTNDGSVLEFSKNGTNVGSISTNANSLPSDRNFKKNIKNLSLGLNFISSLEPVTYNYKIDDDGAPVMAGLIAQDVETALTAEGVEANSMTLLQHNPTEDVKESNYQMDYLKLVPVLINAVKELTERLEQLEKN